jgi:glycosyltransferase involved in cell wall biosynthesis
MKPLRVLHLGKFYPPVRGGMETALQTLCAGHNEAIEPRALVMNRVRKTTHEVVEGVKVTRVASWVTVGAVAVAPSLPVWLARAEADVIVIHEPNPMALLAYCIVRPKAPLIVWYHSEVIRPDRRYRMFYRPLLDFALRRVARVVVASPPMVDAPALAALAEKCTVITYGLEPERYLATAAISERATTLRQPGRGPLLLFIGRLVAYKGLDVLIQALVGVNAQLAIVGDGPRRAEIQERIAALGLTERVRVVGEVSDDERLAWLHACDALVLPSTTRQEAFGMVQLEAMMCGRPVVSTDLPTGVPWVNVNGMTGLVVAAGDVAALTTALQRIVGDEELRAAMGATARQRAATVFTADRMRSAAANLFREVSQACS